MPEWTKEQRKAIETRGKDLLVSAAAGSGKTAVLSARVGEFVEKGGRLDRLLVVTFTKLAAGEMRSRIAKELTDRASSHPSDAHLRRQSMTLYKAKICTIDSFGIDILRRNFQTAGLSPDFTVLDPSDLQVLTGTVLQRQMEAYYQNFPDGFDAFLSLFGGDPDSRKLEDVIRDLAGYLEKIPFPSLWLERQRESLSHPDGAISALCGYLLPFAEEYREILREVDRAAPFGAKGNDSVREDLAFFEELCRLLREERWDEVCRAAAKPLARTASKTKDVTREMMLYGEYRSSNPLAQSGKATYPAFLRQEIFSLDSSVLEEDLARLLPGLRFLFSAVEEFRNSLLEEMHRRAAYSFSALSEMALSLVVSEYSHKTGDFVPSPAALQERALYDEVLIDEYQDVNDQQDLFFRAITRDNCFAVGDVKQSIYGFRGANPGNFLRKKAECTVIALNKNFRSRAGILDLTNFLFQGLFSEAVGGMAYDEGEMLFPGRSPDDACLYPEAYETTLPPAGEGVPPPRKKEKEPDAEILLIPTPHRRDPDDPGLARGEAMLCVKLIRDAVESGATVYDKKENTSRPLRYSDIAILLRAAKSFPDYEAVFREAGIPLLSSDGGTFLETPEVGGVIAFLQAVNDPWDDVALFVTLTGSIFSFSPEQVSYLKDPADPRPLWDGLRLAASRDEACAHVVRTLDRFRILAENLTVPRLIWEIYTATDYLALESSADPRAREQLMKFYSFACSYPRTDGIFGFLEYTDRARASGDVRLSSGAPEGDFVRMMTVHKSKGLEFAWCLLPEMNRNFPADAKSVRIDGTFGVAPKVRNPEETAEYTTLLRELIGLKHSREETAERLRVLYVGLTRARDRLTVISRCSEKLEELDGHGLHSSKGAVRLNTLLAAGNYRKILLDRLVLHPEASVIHSAWQPPEKEPREGLRVAFVSVPCEVEPVRGTKKTLSCGLSSEELNRRFSFRYDAHLSAVPAKVSVTEIAKTPADPDSALLLEEPPVSRPKFLDETALSAAEAGTALHTYCQFADFGKPVAGEIARMVAEGHLSEAAAKSLDEGVLNALLESDLMVRIRRSLRYEREVRFVCRIPVSYYSGNPGEEGEMLMQGAIDLLCETEEGYWIVDFKSDRASEEELLSRYARQLNLYAAAVRRLYEKPVLGCKIWSFRLKRTVDVPEEML